MSDGAKYSRREAINCAAMGSISLAGVFGSVTESAPGQLTVGAAKRIITPNPLLPVSGGMGPTRPTKEKRGDITARAIYLNKDGVSVAIVALDLLGFPSVLGDRVRARIKRIPAENILIGSTHTHSAPDCNAFPDGKGGHTGDLAFMDRVCVLAAEAINEAIDKAKPAHLKINTDEAKGKIAYNYYAPDLIDRRMTVIQAIGMEGKAIATLINYAIHPEVLGNSVGILSPDLIGPLCDKTEQKAGGMAIFMNSAQGGMVTADNRDYSKPRDPQRAYWDDMRTWEECIRIGHTMSDEALRIVSSVPIQANPNLFCTSSMVTIPVDTFEMWAVVTMSPLKYPHGTNKTIKARINLLNIGNAQIVTCPGEALPNIGFYVKRKMRGAHNMVFGLTNDAFGYILTKVDFHSFSRYDYCSRTSLGEMTGEILIEKWIEMVKSAPAPDKF
ncbi:MAG: hypothetical protein ABJA67_15320 [Chthonomonadales bacterium]